MIKRILVVGQTPPPLHGQSIMIGKLLEGDYGDIELIHLRLAYSQNIYEISKFNITKILELFNVICKIIILRIKLHIPIIYYPPAGPTLVPILRDVLTLIPTRWMFKKTIFHFHASGLTDIYPSLPWLLRPFFIAAYHQPDAVIRLSEFAPEDGRKLKAKKEFIIPYGIEDHYPKYLSLIPRKRVGEVRILFVGLLTESKGVRICLEAGRILLERGCSIHLAMVGKFQSKEYEKEIERFIIINKLDGIVDFLGELSGDEKWKQYASADIFCFPTYYESEAFSVVLLEALSFGLPIVTTHWRGLPSIIENGKSGFLVPTKNARAVADRIEQLIEDPSLMASMRVHSRQRYLNYFTIQRYHKNLKFVFDTLIRELE